MLIGIDGNEANIKNRVGVGRYAFELLRQFHEMVQGSRFKVQSDNLKFQIYLKNNPLDDLPEETDWWEYKTVKPTKLWTQIALPVYLYTYFPRPDVFFTPSHYAPRFCPCPRVISIMDFSFLRYPEMFKVNDLYQLKNWTAYSVKKAVKVLTISQSSKNDIINYYGVKEKKVVVTYPGLTKVESIKYQVESMENIKKKYGINGDYILSVGTLQPRKNYVRLIEAFARVININSNKLRDPSTSLGMTGSLELIIVGKKGWLYGEILSAPKKFGVEDKVKFLDYVSDEDLSSLYRNARCFVLVSLYEGFGLPVLEAMSYGCPVIVSNASSLPEVAGEAGILVNPEKTEEISDKLLMMLKLPKEKREEMIKKGQEQARKFSWEKCAQETLAVLEEIGGEDV